jgi:hypothetical protein
VPTSELATTAATPLAPKRSQQLVTRICATAFNPRTRLAARCASATGWKAAAAVKAKIL